MRKWELIYDERQEKHGVVINVKKVNIYGLEGVKIYQINFENNFEFLKKPELLKNVSWYDSNFNLCKFYFIDPKKQDDENIGLVIKPGISVLKCKLDELLIMSDLVEAIKFAKLNKFAIEIDRKRQ